jgi:hypothetical protein
MGDNARLDRSGARRMALQALRRLRNSWQGHLAIYLLCYGLPISMIFLLVIGLEGTLTPTWTAFIVLVCAVASVLLGSLVWWFYSKPRLARAMRQQARE